MTDRFFSAATSRMLPLDSRCVRNAMQSSMQSLRDKQRSARSSSRHPRIPQRLRAAHAAKSSTSLDLMLKSSASARTIGYCNLPWRNCYRPPLVHAVFFFDILEQRSLGCPATQTRSGTEKRKKTTEWTLFSQPHARHWSPTLVSPSFSCGVRTFGNGALGTFAMR